MAQLTVWTALEKEGFGCSLQVGAASIQCPDIIDSALPTIALQPLGRQRRPKQVEGSPHLEASRPDALRCSYRRARAQRLQVLGGASYGSRQERLNTRLHSHLHIENKANSFHQLDFVSCAAGKESCITRINR